ncbi:MAG: hypothetical protein DRO36_07305, partial [Candidatus Hecatellales archaeon]
TSKNGSEFDNNSAEYLAKIEVKDRIEDLESKYGSYECIVKPRENYTLVIFQPENMEYNNSYEVVLVYVKNEGIIKVETETVTPGIITPESPKPIQINGIKIVKVNERGDVKVNYQRIIDLALMDSEVREIVEFLERRYGKVYPKVEAFNPYSDTSAMVHFSIDIDPQKIEKIKKEPVAFPTEPRGFFCWVNLTTGKVEKIIRAYKADRLIDIVLTDKVARSKLETLKEKHGNVSVVFAMSPDEPDIVELIFRPDYNPHEERTEELYGILCVVDMETKKVVKIKEFNISPISVPTPSQNSLLEPKLRLYLNNDKEEFVHEFVQGERIRIFLENIGNETIPLPNPPWEVIVLPMIDAEIESKLHCSPEESVYAKFPKIYPDMYNISNALIYKPKVEQTAVLIHPNETLTWTWDQRLNDGGLLKPGHYQVVLRGLDVKCVEQTIFYVLPKQ